MKYIKSIYLFMQLLSANHRKSINAPVFLFGRFVVLLARTPLEATQAGRESFPTHHVHISTLSFQWTLNANILIECQ
jgi:hypothetical protein